MGRLEEVRGVGDQICEMTQGGRCHLQGASGSFRLQMLL